MVQVVLPPRKCGISSDNATADIRDKQSFLLIIADEGLISIAVA